MIKFILIFCLLFFNLNLKANCLKFEETLLRIVEGKSSHAVNPIQFKSFHSEGLTLPRGSNRDFMKTMELDANSGKKVIYFDVENSVQKKINDEIFSEKTMPDAINNAFMKNIYSEINSDPKLKSLIANQYKDYKSLRFRLEIKESDNPIEIEELLKAAYERANKKFTQEMYDANFKYLLAGRTDGLEDYSRWFLSGTGETAIEANMAARSARKLTIGHVAYRDQIQKISKDIRQIEVTRKDLATSTKLLDAEILLKDHGGEIILSKDAIAIFRKNRPNKYDNDELFSTDMQTKFKNVFGVDVSKQDIKKMNQYFEQVDSISPPLFTRERVEIDLAKAKHGLISVDFTGVGVENIQAQMKALSKINYRSADIELSAAAFKEMEKEIRNVTTDMNIAKRIFSNSAAKVREGELPLFSGDDGMLMPTSGIWSYEDKRNLVSSMSKTSSPDKYRVTFVETKYSNGNIISAKDRSERVVRAENLEKDIRKKIHGMDKMTSQDMSQIMIAIDSKPETSGGRFTLMVSGNKLSDKEKKLIRDAFNNSIDKEKGESIIGIDFIE